jgi:hypothetical protein
MKELREAKKVAKTGLDYFALALYLQSINFREKEEQVDEPVRT